MQLFLTALAILVNIFMSIPSRNKALTDEKKPILGKSLVIFVNLIDIAIEKGEKIIDSIDRLIKYGDVCSAKDSLLRLINEQLVILHEISSQISKKVLWNSEDYGFTDIPECSDVSQVLSIFQPGLISSLESIISLKLEILSQAMLILADDIKNFVPGKCIIREIESAEATDIFMAYYSVNPKETALLDHYQEMVENGDIIVTHYDMANSTERSEYILKIKTGLSDLKKGRENVAEFIRQHFEPHHLI
jgi:hypothetical protein